MSSLSSPHEVARALTEESGVWRRLARGGDSIIGDVSERGDGEDGGIGDASATALGVGGGEYGGGAVALLELLDAGQSEYGGGAVALLELLTSLGGGEARVDAAFGFGMPL